MNNLYTYCLISCWILLLGISCTPTPSGLNQEHGQNDSTTQVVLKIQDGPFLLEEKSKIKEEYTSPESLTVPKDLAPQNKWVMFEGPVLENELIAYRFYMDSRHRSDIYGKKTNDLVMDTVGWNYHDIMDWGTDVLKVGESLGIGAPAIWYQDSLYTLSNCREKTAKVIKAAGVEAQVEFIFEDLQFGSETQTIVQNWSITSGRPHAKVQLSIENGTLPEGAYFATGLVKHLEAAESGQQDQQFYLLSWGKQSYHEQNLGLGIVASSTYAPQIKEHPLNHLVIFEQSQSGVEYEFAAAWEADRMEINDAATFKKRLLQ